MQTWHDLTDKSHSGRFGPIIQASDSTSGREWSHGSWSLAWRFRAGCLGVALQPFSVAREYTDNPSLPARVCQQSFLTRFLPAEAWPVSEGPSVPQSSRECGHSSLHSFHSAPDLSAPSLHTHFSQNKAEFWTWLGKQQDPAQDWICFRLKMHF